MKPGAKEKFPLLNEFKTIRNELIYKKRPNIRTILKASKNLTDFKNKIKNISKRDLKKICKFTNGQYKTSQWYYYRRGVITATLTHKLSKTPPPPCSDKIKFSITKSKYPSTQLFYPAIVYGRENENRAIQEFLKYFKKFHHDVKISNQGLMLHKIYKFIGGSVDGIITCSCCRPAVLEIKCPYSIRDGNPEKKGFNDLPYLDQNMKLKTTHPYFFQIQSYLAIYEMEIAYLCIWTDGAAGIRVINVEFDPNFWGLLCKKLIDYYFEVYAPTELMY